MYCHHSFEFSKALHIFFLNNLFADRRYFFFNYQNSLHIFVHQLQFLILILDDLLLQLFLFSLNIQLFFGIFKSNNSVEEITFSRRKFQLKYTTRSYSIFFSMKLSHLSKILTKKWWKKSVIIVAHYSYLLLHSYGEIYTHLDLNACTRPALLRWLNINVLWRWMLLCQTSNIHTSRLVVGFSFSICCVWLLMCLCVCIVHINTHVWLFEWSKWRFDRYRNKHEIIQYDLFTIIDISKCQFLNEFFYWTNKWIIAKFSEYISLNQRKFIHKIFTWTKKQVFIEINANSTVVLNAHGHCDCHMIDVNFENHKNIWNKWKLYLDLFKEEKTLECPVLVVI